MLKTREQTLIGGNYGLLNTTTFALNPDYYSTVLWHQLMGKKVLAVSSDVHIKDFYLQLENSGKGRTTPKGSCSRQGRR
eukprot:XP_025982777.1 heparanase-like protein 1 [Glycine max]